MGSHEARKRPAQEDAGEKSRHHGAHRRAPALRGRQMGGKGDDLLRHRRQQPHRQRRGHQRQGIGREGRKGEGQRKQGELQHDEPLALHEVAQRYQQEQSRRIAELCGGGDGSGETIRQIGLDQFEHGLVVIDVRNGKAGRRRHRKRGPVAKRKAQPPGALRAGAVLKGHGTHHHVIGQEGRTGGHGPGATGKIALGPFTSRIAL